MYKEKGASRKKALTMEQIAKIANFELATPTQRKRRDIWLFIYMCNGINVADLVRLKYSDIYDGEIYFIRKKTANTTSVVKEITVTITPYMQNIIDRWGNPVSPDNYIFPLIRIFDDPIKHKNEVKDCLRRINKTMKMIGNELGIGEITTCAARHSFATVLKRSGANIVYISESLGHRDSKTTEHYLASFEKEERQKNASLLMQFEAM